MTRYANRGGNSGVTHYKIQADSINVIFTDGSEYLYDYVRPGRVHVDHMKTLAQNGSGLNSYISSVIKKNFAQKIR